MLITSVHTLCMFPETYTIDCITRHAVLSGGVRTRVTRTMLEWVGDIRLFVEHLVTLPGYDNPELVIDRINNNGNYEPGNLRFATWSESNYNRRLPSRKEV